MTGAKLAGLLLLSAALWVGLFLATSLALQRAQCAGLLPDHVDGALHGFAAVRRAVRGVACR
jgi:hypothetical protein